MRYKAGIGVIAGKTVWSIPECLECEVVQKALYKSAYLLPFLFTNSTVIVRQQCSMNKQTAGYVVNGTHCSDPGTDSRRCHCCSRRHRRLWTVDKVWYVRRRHSLPAHTHSKTPLGHLHLNPLITTLKLHSCRPSYSNTVIGTLAVDGWAVTSGTARRGLGGAAARPGPSSLYEM